MIQLKLEIGKTDKKSPSGKIIMNGKVIHDGIYTKNTIDLLPQIGNNKLEISLDNKTDRDTLIKGNQILEDVYVVVKDIKCEITQDSAGLLDQIGQYETEKKETLKSGKRMVRAPVKGKVSETEFIIISSGNSNSLIRAKIITGRTHQIRVHASHKGYPIVGDIKYGDALYNKQLQSKGLKRMLLHAESINFKNLAIEQFTPVPEIFSKYV